MQKKEISIKSANLLKIVPKKAILLNIDINSSIKPFSLLCKKKNEQIVFDDTLKFDESEEYIYDQLGLEDALELIEKEENFIIIFFTRKRSLWEKFQTEKGIIVPLILMFFIRLEKLDKIIFPIYDGQRYLILRRRKISKFLRRLVKEREASIYLSDWCLRDLLEESLRDSVAPFLHQYFKVRDLICTRTPYVEEEKDEERDEPFKGPLVTYLQQSPGEFAL